MVTTRHGERSSSCRILTTKITNGQHWNARSADILSCIFSLQYLQPSCSFHNTIIWPLPVPVITGHYLIIFVDICNLQPKYVTHLEKPLIDLFRLPMPLGHVGAPVWTVEGLCVHVHHVVQSQQADLVWRQLKGVVKATCQEFFFTKKNNTFLSMTFSPTYSGSTDG